MNTNVSLQGARLRLIAPDAALAAEHLSRWAHNFTYSRLLDTDPARIWSVDAVKKWFEDEEKGGGAPTSVIWLMQKLEDDQVIGFIGLDGIRWEHGECWVGMVRSFIDAAGNAKFNRQRGYTEHISVRRPWRKHGVARALIALSLQALKDEGCTEAALGVDTQNLSGALRLYQSMGFVSVKRSITYRKLFPSP